MSYRGRLFRFILAKNEEEHVADIWSRKVLLFLVRGLSDLGHSREYIEELFSSETELGEALVSVSKVLKDKITLGSPPSRIRDNLTKFTSLVSSKKSELASKESELRDWKSGVAGEGTQVGEARELLEAARADLAIAQEAKDTESIVEHSSKISKLESVLDSLIGYEISELEYDIGRLRKLLVDFIRERDAAKEALEPYERKLAEYSSILSRLTVDYVVSAVSSLGHRTLSAILDHTFGG